MGHVSVTEEISATPAAVFGYVDDYRNTTKYMKGLTKWAPAGAKTHGKGATFEVAMKAGPLTLSSVVDITTWTQDRTIGWTSRQGFKQKGKWSFVAHGDNTSATLDMDYELPGGFAGRMASKLADPVVHSNIAQSVRNLRTHMEKAPAPAKAPRKGAPKR